MGFLGTAQEWGGGGAAKRFPPPTISHISYNDETTHTYTLPKEDPKNI